MICMIWTLINRCSNYKYNSNALTSLSSFAKTGWYNQDKVYFKVYIIPLLSRNNSQSHQPSVSYNITTALSPCSLSYLTLLYLSIKLGKQTNTEISYIVSQFCVSINAQECIDTVPPGLWHTRSDGRLRGRRSKDEAKID